MSEIYTHGYHESVLRSLTWRTAPKWRQWNEC